MAKYKVAYACGHVIEESLFGKEDDRRRTIAAAQSKDCPGCARAKQLARAEDAATAAGLPALTGSDKQVSWAMTIRARFISELDQTLARANMDAFSPAHKTAIETFRGQSAASWWIDRRNDSLNKILMSFLKEE